MAAWAGSETGGNSLPNRRCADVEIMARDGGDADARRVGLASGRGCQGRRGGIRAPLWGDAGETVRGRIAYLAASRSCRRCHAGRVSSHMARRWGFRPWNCHADHLDGGNRTQPRTRPGTHRLGTQEERGLARCRAESIPYSLGRPGSGGALRDDRGAAAAAGLPRRPRTRAAPAGAACILRRLEPRAACGQTRYAGRHGEDLAPAKFDPDPRAPGIMSEHDDKTTRLARTTVSGPPSTCSDELAMRAFS